MLGHWIQNTTIESLREEKYSERNLVVFLFMPKATSLFSFICEYKNGSFIPMIIFARKMQIIFVNHEQLILMRSKDNKLMETWVWDRSLSMNCRGFCLGQHGETINFTVSLPARTNWWFKGKKILLRQDVLAIFLWLSCFQKNAVCPWHWLAFSLNFS